MYRIYHSYGERVAPIGEPSAVSPDERIQDRQHAGEDYRHRYQDVGLPWDDFPVGSKAGRDKPGKRDQRRRREALRQEWKVSVITLEKTLSRAHCTYCTHEEYARK